MNRSRILLVARLVFVSAAFLASPAPGRSAFSAPVEGNRGVPAGAVEAPDPAISPPNDAITSTDSHDNAGDADEESLSRTLFSTLLSLGAILVLIYLTLNFGLRRLMWIRGIPFGRPGVVKVVERVTLDPKRVLFVVRAAGEYLLVGGGDHGLSLITALNAQEVERVLDIGKPLPTPPGTFLQKLLSKRDQDPPAGKV